MMKKKLLNPKLLIIFGLVLCGSIFASSYFLYADKKDIIADSNGRDIELCENELEPWKVLYESYVRNHADLLAAYNASSGSQTIESWGRSHYENFGKHEERSLSVSFRQLAEYMPDFFLLNFVDEPTTSTRVVSTDTSTIFSNDGLELHHLQTSICELIDIWKSHDVILLRDRLISFIWGESNLPTSLPNNIVKDYKEDKRWNYKHKSSAPYNGLENLLRIDKITMELEFGIQSIVYHFLPSKSNGAVILFHQGHGGDFHKSKGLIETFLRKGYSIVGFSMPLLNINNQPTVYLPRIGYLQLATHEDLKYLNPIDGHPIKFFFEPVVEVLNYLEEYYEYELFSMVGISGGGWTTTIISAIDTRIKLSFPVAGTVPIFLRNSDDGIDWEQSVHDFYRIANNLELYVMGAHGKRRKQLQIVNYEDPCCFGGRRMSLYKDAIRSRVSRLGVGEFDLFIDTKSDQHVVSNAAIELIDKEIGEFKNILK